MSIPKTIGPLVFLKKFGLLILSKTEKFFGQISSEIQKKTADRGRLLDVLFSILFSLSAATILLLKIPYSFETNDHYQYLLLPYRSIYNSFLVGDWFTWQTTHYHISFSYLIRALHFLFGKTGFPIALFVVHIAVSAMLGFACLRASRAMKLHWFSAAVAVLVIAFVRRTGIADVTICPNVMLPTGAAMPFIVLGFAYWIEDKPLPAGVHLGIAGLIHANFAVVGPLVIALFEIVKIIKTKNLKPSLMLVGGFLFFAWPSLVVAVLGFFSSDTNPEAVRIFFEYRSPHHYKPLLGTTSDVYWPIVLLAAGTPVWLAHFKNRSFRTIAVISSMMLLLIFAAVTTLVFDSAAITRLFLWRLSAPLLLFAAIAFGENLAAAFITRKPFEIVYGLSSLILVLAFSTDGHLKYSSQIDMRGFGILIPFSAFLIAAPLVLRSRFGVARYFAIGVAIVPLLVALAASVNTPFFDKNIQINWMSAQKKWSKIRLPDSDGIFGKKRVLPIYSWIKKHTPQNAVFLIPPGLDDFRLKAKRAAFVDWKCCPMKGDEIEEWDRRMKAAIGTKKLPAKGFALNREATRYFLSRRIESLVLTAEKEGLTHILARNEKKVPKKLTKLTTKGGYSVYRLKHNN